MASVDKPPSRTFGGRSKFSWTLRLAKMPRSSGHRAIPKRAIRCEGRSISSRPSSFTDPERLERIPMIDLSVVVLPAPFRPRMVTSSPAWTSSVIPCKTCDSPYQAFSPAISRNGASAGLGLRPRAAWANSGNGGPHVGLHHCAILGHGGVIALGDDLASRQHGNGVAKIGDHAQVVLRHQHGSLCGDAFDQRGDSPHVLMPHA